MPPISVPNLAAHTLTSTSPPPPTKPPASALASRPTQAPVSPAISSTKHVPELPALRTFKPWRTHAHDYRLGSQLRKRAAADAAPHGADAAELLQLLPDRNLDPQRQPVRER